MARNTKGDGGITQIKDKNGKPIPNRWRVCVSLGTGLSGTTLNKLRILLNFMSGKLLMSLPVRPLALTKGWMHSNSRWKRAAAVAGCRFVLAHEATSSLILSGTYAAGAGWKPVPAISASTSR